MNLYKILILISIFNINFSQGVLDLYDYSQNNFSGDAKVMGAANSLTGTGSYLSSITYNPASGSKLNDFYFSFSSKFDYNQNTSYLKNSESKMNRLAFSINNLYLSTTFFHPTKRPNGGNSRLTLGYNQSHTFNERNFISSTSDLSLIDEMVFFAQGTDINDLNPYFERLFVDTKLIKATSQTSYTANLPDSTNINIRNFMTNKRGKGEYFVAFSHNYNDKLFIGADISLHSINRKKIKTHNETVSNYDSIYTTRAFTFNENYGTSATGISGSIGFIYNIYKDLNIGLAYKSPVFYQVIDSFSTNISSELSDGKNYNINSAYTNLLEYSIKTPSIITLSLAYSMNKRFNINFDLRMQNYKKAKYYKFDEVFNSYFESVNKDYSDNFNNNYTFGIGSEYRATNHIYLRAGASFTTSSIQKYPDEYKNLLLASGFGYRNSKVSFDLALNHNNIKYFYRPNLIMENAKINKTNISLITSLTYNF